MTDGDSSNAKELAELDVRVQQLKGMLASASVVRPPEDSTPTVRKEASWNIVALFSTLLIGLPAAVISRLSIEGGGWNWGAIGVLVIALTASSIFGIAASIVAMVRGERWPGMTGFAFFMHLFVLVGLSILFSHR